MRWTKTVIFSLILLFLSPIFTAHISVATESDKQRIFDEANLLTDAEIARLEKTAQYYSEKRETDFIIITQADPGKDMEKFLDDFYDEQGLGFDKSHGNTAMLGIDMKNRDVVLQGYYKAETYLNQQRIDQILDQIAPDLSDENYDVAFDSFIKIVDKYMDYRPGVNPENPFYKTSVQFMLAIGLGIVIVFSMAYHTKPKMTTTARTYRDTERTKVLQKRDRYIRTTVTKRRKPKQSSGGGGSGRSSGGYGRTSGGHSRSSGRRKF